METNRQSTNFKLLLPALFIASRFIMLMGFSLDGLKGYGDYWSYLPIARLGFPYIDLWVEYPPVFPIISHILESFSTSAHSYEYMLFIFFSLVQIFNIYIFVMISQKLNFSEIRLAIVGFSYTVLSIILPYTWWTFDVLCLLMILTAILFFLQRKFIWSGAAVGFGILVKLFPVILYILPIKYNSRRRSLSFYSTALLVPIIVYGAFIYLSPAYTKASIVSQYAKGSWESVWALVDGNMATGNFSEMIDRQDAETAYISTGNPAKISPLLTLPLFMLIGFFSIRKLSQDPQISIIPLIGLINCIFYLWSPGWSPQWVIYLLPLLLLGLPVNTALLSALTFISINLLEWPVLLSRGRFDLLWLTISIRTLLFVLFAFVFYLNGIQPTMNEIDKTLQTVER